MNTQRRPSGQVSVWGGDRGNGWLQCSKNIPDAAAWRRFSPANPHPLQSWSSVSGETMFKPDHMLPPQTGIKTHLQRSFGMGREELQQGGCGEMMRKRSKDPEAGLVPRCHYPHFLATVGRLPCNEGRFQEFSPGTCKIQQWSPQIPRTRRLYPGL